MSLFVDGVEIDTVFVDGVEQESVFVDGVEVFTALAPPGSEVFDVSGNFIVPRGYREVVICICGAGGPGGGDFSSNGGGGGGSGVLKVRVSVVPGEVIPITIAGRSAYGSPGASSTFAAASGSIVAAGGGWGGIGNAFGLGVNGGGNGGQGGIGDERRRGDSCAASCDGTVYAGGNVGGFGDIASGGGGGFGQGGHELAAALTANRGAGGGGSSKNAAGLDGAGGRCIVYWGDTHPPAPSPDPIPPEFTIGQNPSGAERGFSMSSTPYGSIVPEFHDGIRIRFLLAGGDTTVLGFNTGNGQIAGVNTIRLTLDGVPAADLQWGGLSYRVINLAMSEHIINNLGNTIAWAMESL